VHRRLRWSNKPLVADAEVDFDDGRIEHMFAESTCSFPGCERARRTHGLCRSHYAQQWRTGSLWPLGTQRRVRRRCDFEGCDKLAVNRGLCQGHHQQRKKGQPLRPLRPFYGTKGPCRFDGCSKPRVSGGYCAGHAAQYYGGRPLSPCSDPSPIATFPAAKNGISRLATAKDIGDNCGWAAHSLPFVRS
jgi:hypothetical protein